MRVHALSLLAVALAASACGSGIQVTTDWDPEQDFSRIQTFAVLDAPEGSDLTSLTQGRIKSAIREAMTANVAIVEGLAAIAGRYGATPARVSLAWLLRQGPAVLPIPGTKRRKCLEENVASVNVHLTDQDMADIAALPRSVAPRY